MERKVISLAEYRKSRKAQARILKRLIERHLAEAGRILAPDGTNCTGRENFLRETAEE